jgi:glycosyltransferase involved in cell wall biosynthesis
MLAAKQRHLLNRSAMVEVSVIIPCYNSVQFVADAIDSVLQSGFSSCEILVVDDGSTEPVEPYLKKKYPDVQKLHCIRQANRGLSGARNTGIAHAAGRYLVFLDADDIILPDKLSAQLDYLRSNPDIDIVYSYSEWFEAGDLQATFPVQFPVYEGQLLRHLLFGNFIHVNTILIPKEIVLEQGGFDESLRELEDWDLWLRLSLAGKTFGCIPRVLSKVRVHFGSMTSNQQKMNATMVRVLLKNKPLILHKSKTVPGLTKEYYTSLLNYCILAKQPKEFRKNFSEAFAALGAGFFYQGSKLLLKKIRSFFFTPVNQTTKELEHVWKDKKTVR